MKKQTKKLGRYCSICGKRFIPTSKRGRYCENCLKKRIKARSKAIKIAKTTKPCGYYYLR